VTVLHFFLFCNVFRLRRSYELIWTGAYVVNLGCEIWLGGVDWAKVLALQGPLTLILIVAEARSSCYHGVFWRWLNPQLDESRSRG
jgi:hypothetical protein